MTFMNRLHRFTAVPLLKFHTTAETVALNFCSGTAIKLGKCKMTAP